MISEPSTYERKLQVGHPESYELNVSRWASGEPITSLTVTVDARSTKVAQAIDGARLKVTLSGATAGTSVIKFEFETATRSRCVEKSVIVVDECD